MKKKCAIILLFIIILLGLLFWAYRYVMHFSNIVLPISQETLFKLPQGTGRAGLSHLLKRDKLIQHERLMPILFYLEPQLAAFKAGTYRLVPGMTLRQFLQLLVSGKEVQFNIRFIEGSKFTDWLTILQKAPYVKQTIAAKNSDQIAIALGMQSESDLEGYFYPDTYSYTAGTSDIALLKRANKRMSKLLQQIWQTRDANLPYKSERDLLTMASLIEKETSISAERSQIASVFINRLRIGMRLQTDPSVIYGMGANYKSPLTRKDLEIASPYNTYMNSGLPPTPIAMPGLASLQAAAHPANTSYLYFVADGKGGHIFTSNLTNHNQAVRAYRQALKEKNER